MCFCIQCTVHPVLFPFRSSSKFPFSFSPSRYSRSVFSFSLSIFLCDIFIFLTLLWSQIFNIICGSAIKEFRLHLAYALCIQSRTRTHYIRVWITWAIHWALRDKVNGWEIGSLYSNNRRNFRGEYFHERVYRFCVDLLPLSLLYYFVFGTKSFVLSSSFFFSLFSSLVLFCSHATLEAECETICRNLLSLVSIPYIRFVLPTPSTMYACKFNQIMTENIENI